MSVLLKAVPIMTDLRQALDANMALTLDGRHMVCGESCRVSIFYDSVLLGCDDTSLGNWFPTVRDSLVV